MPETNANGRQPGGLNPQALRQEDLARILTAFGPRPVSVDMLRADIEQGAPTNCDGTVNLLHLAAWLAKKETGRAAD
jgi:hypothetical protein